MKILMISRDPKIKDPNSAVSKRIEEYRKLFEEYRVILMKGNVLSFFHAFVLASQNVRGMSKGDYITAQDVESGVVAFIVAKLFGLRFQLQLHTDVFDPYFKRHSIINLIRSMLARMLIRRSDSLRVVSAGIADTVRQVVPIDDAKMSVLPIYIDTGAMLGKSPTFNLKTKYPQFSKIVLLVGRLEREKNFELALSAFHKMLRLKKDIGLVIAGDGGREKWLREYVRHLGIEEFVKFEGFVSDAVSLYKSADVMLVTSLYEGYGMAIVEALACGCPVVATDVGIAEEAGAILANFDAGEIAVKALDVISNEIKGVLNPALNITKEHHLEKYKKSFI